MQAITKTSPAGHYRLPCTTARPRIFAARPASASPNLPHTPFELLHDAVELVDNEQVSRAVGADDLQPIADASPENLAEIPLVSVDLADIGQCDDPEGALEHRVQDVRRKDYAPSRQVQVTSHSAGRRLGAISPPSLSDELPIELRHLRGQSDILTHTNSPPRGQHTCSCQA